MAEGPGSASRQLRSSLACKPKKGYHHGQIGYLEFIHESEEMVVFLFLQVDLKYEKTFRRLIHELIATRFAFCSNSHFYFAYSSISINAIAMTYDRHLPLTVRGVSEF
jgi:hypothetical protein